jgi:hypothetical protein
VLPEAKRLAEQYQFFHWHLAFPDVFQVPLASPPENDSCGWSGGFDLILGNPPWGANADVKQELESKGFSRTQVE